MCFHFISDIITSKGKDSLSSINCKMIRNSHNLFKSCPPLSIPFYVSNLILDFCQKGNCGVCPITFKPLSLYATEPSFSFLSVRRETTNIAYLAFVDFEELLLFMD